MKAPTQGLLVLLATALHLAGQAFDPGGNGELGNLVLTNSITLPLPPDGRLKVRSLTIGPNAVVTFRPNAANTPVYVLSQGDIRIEGQIQLVGQGAPASTISGGLGGPGGFRGGNRATDGLSAGPGHGPGGGGQQFGNIRDWELAGAAGHRWSPANGRNAQNGAAYGTPVLIPLIGGSGGGGGWENAGGGGGGAILLASATRIGHFGAISANGGEAADYNGGSGGAVRLVAPIIEGNGIIDVRGASASAPGRIRIDSVDARNPNFNTPDTVASTGSLLLTGLDLPGAPRLEVVQIGRIAVVPGEQNSVSILLPAGSTPEQPVTLRAANFGRKFALQVVLTPDTGGRQTYTAEVDNSNPGSVDIAVPVTFPVNVTTFVQVWTVPGQ
jgi:hypothetical protein